MITLEKREAKVNDIINELVVSFKAGQDIEGYRKKMNKHGYGFLNVVRVVRANGEFVYACNKNFAEFVNITHGELCNGIVIANVGWTKEDQEFGNNSSYFFFQQDHEDLQFVAE